MRLLVVDDNRLACEGLALCLRSVPVVTSIEVVWEADRALTAVESSRADAVLLSASTDPGRELLRALVRACPSVAVIVTGAAETEDDVIGYAEAGATGYLPRRASLADLQAVIDGIMRAEMAFPPRVAFTLFRHISRLTAERQLAERRTAVGCEALSRRELQILDLIEKGLANKEIAQQLSIDFRTVKNHVHNILGKLRVHRRGQAVAKTRGLFPTGLPGDGTSRR